jgi:hypothetical protein
MRGMGRTYQTTWTDKKTGKKRKSPNWSIAYTLRGKPVRKTAHTTKESEARKLLKKRLGEAALGRPVGPDVEKSNFEDMAAMIVNDHKANGRRSLARLEDALEHLRGYFGDHRAVEITGDLVTAYVTYRQDQKQRIPPSTMSSQHCRGCSLWASDRTRSPVNPISASWPLTVQGKAFSNGSSFVPCSIICPRTSDPP